MARTGPYDHAEAPMDAPDKLADAGALPSGDGCLLVDCSLLDADVPGVAGEIPAVPQGE